MGEISVPSQEITSIVALAIEAFQSQTGKELDRSQLTPLFVTGRDGYKFGLDIRVRLSDAVDSVIRTYVQINEGVFKHSFGPYRQEEVQDATVVQKDPTYVAFAILPQSRFPTLQKFNRPPSAREIGVLIASFDETEISMDDDTLTMDDQ